MTTLTCRAASAARQVLLLTSGFVLLEEVFDLLIRLVTRDGVTLLNQAGQSLLVAFCFQATRLRSTCPKRSWRRRAAASACP